MNNNNIYTIGYGGRKPDELVKLFKNTGIKLVVDVRISPRGYLTQYTYYPSGVRGLSKLLNDNDINYIWDKSLGNEWGTHRGFKKHFTNYYEIEKYKLCGLFSSTCFLCCEKDYRKCHRQYIANYIEQFGNNIIHL